MGEARGSEARTQASGHGGLLLARFLDQRLDGQACLLAERKVALLAAGSTRLDDLVVELRAVIKSLCHCEEAVLFVADPASVKLLPIGEEDTLNWTASRNTPSEQCYYMAQDRESRTVKVFRNRLPNRTREKADKQPGTARMKLKRKDAEGYVFVLAAPMVDALGRSTGVVRCANRFFGRGLRFFHHDELALLDAIIQSAMPRVATLRGEWLQRSQLRKVTHELKRPLLVIIGAVEAIDTVWKERIKEYKFPDLPFPWFDDVHSWCGIMRSQLLNPDYLAVDSRKIQLRIQPISLLPDILAPIVRWMRVELDARELPVRNSHNFPTISQGTHLLPLLHVDRNMFQQIFFNLLDNAIKYAKPEAPNKFSIEIRSETQPGEFVIWVRDHGVGVNDVEDLNLLFADGVRGVNAWRQDLNGTGYGLWVVKRLVELHHGRIEITKRNDPTEFTLRFPGFLSSPTWNDTTGRQQQLT